MLVLKRFVGERTFLVFPGAGGDVVVELDIVEAIPGAARLGITAPDEVLILRDNHVGDRDPLDVVKDWRRGQRPPSGSTAVA